jgi:hypothetical protein
MEAFLSAERNVMKTEPATAAYAKSALVDASAATQINSKSAPAKTVSTIPDVSQAGASTVSISGRAILISRLFNGRDSEPPVLSAAGGFASGILDMPVLHFLNAQDRSVLSDMYSYAQQQGADLQHVDSVAASMALYRQFGDGKYLGGMNDGHSFDLEGHLRTVNFSAEDTEIANRILDSDAMATTRVDQGFLRYMLSATNSPSNTMSIAFLEKMVNKFSDQATDEPLGSEFSNLIPSTLANNRLVLTHSKEVVLKFPAVSASDSENSESPDKSTIDLKALGLGSSKFDLESLKNSGLSVSQFVLATKNAGILSAALLQGLKVSPDSTVMSRFAELLQPPEK